MRNEKQAERRQRGEDFQEECRRSWRQIPNLWRLRITDGGSLGTRPADELVLLEHVNLLCEEKRTDGDRFMLSMLRADQLTGLINFEKALDRNIGLVLVSFLNEAVDVAYAFRLVHAMAYMNQKGRRYITLEELQQGKIEAINLPRIEINGERGYDLKGVRDCTYTKDHNITLGDGYLRLVYQMVDDNGIPFRDELKTDLSRRSLMITEEMVLLLIFWRLIQNTEKRKAAERGIEYNPDNLVFCTRKGTYIYPRNFTKMWSENLRSMGIDHKRFHDLRHTVATVMLEDGEAMNTVQEQLGHYDAGFTASRYGHVTAKMRNSAAVKLGERLEKVRNPEAEDAEDANSVKNEDTVIPFQEGRKLKSAACKIK